MEEKLKRLHHAIDYLKDSGQIHKQQDIADTLGMPKGRISDALHGGRYFTEGFLKRFAAAYSDYINEAWLLDGAGPMERVDTSAMRPHIPLPVAAGFTGAPIGSVSADEVEFYAMVPGVPDYDFSINVTGDSMEPQLYDGDTLLCRWVELPDIRPGRLYVVDTTEGPVVKSVEVIGSDLRCTSLNPLYSPFLQPLDTNLRLARVIASIHTFN